VIVIDLGCKTWGEQDSLSELEYRFRPDLLFGFDPHAEAGEGIDHWGPNGECVRVFARRAAWLFDGFVDWVEDGDCSGIPDEPGMTPAVVACFNFGSFLSALPQGDLVVKMDIEGGEYPLLADLAMRGLDERISLLLVEWHTPELSHGLFAERPELRCPVEEWP